jgi:hypothetical protein
MDKNIITTFICLIVFYIVYLKISYQDKNNKFEDEQELKIDNEEFENNIDTNRKFDIYNFYSNMSNSNTPKKITKDNFDFDYETDFKYKNIPIVSERIKEDFRYSHMYPHNNVNLESQGGGVHDEEKNSTLSNIRFQEESPNFTNTNFLVPNEIDSNVIYSIPFPENTSIELAQFNAENVTDLYNANNMEDLYNNINADVYRGYKTMKYML